MYTADAITWTTHKLHCIAEKAAIRCRLMTDLDARVTNRTASCGFSSASALAHAQPNNTEQDNTAIKTTYFAVLQHMRTIAIKQSYLQVGANLHKTCTTVALRGAHMYNKTTKKQNNNWKRSASTPFTVDHTQSRTWRYKLAENLCITAGVRMHAEETAMQQNKSFCFVLFNVAAHVRTSLQ